MNAKPPEGTNPDAGATLPVPTGATAAMVALGNRIYHGEAGGASCTGCHGADGAGTPLGPNLTGKQWLWSDGSVDGIAATITDGVMQPKQYRAPMPAMGGAQLSGQIKCVRWQRTSGAWRESGDRLLFDQSGSGCGHIGTASFGS
jgi:mono/diheme cytochrome c family protein